MRRRPAPSRQRVSFALSALEILDRTELDVPQGVRNLDPVIVPGSGLQAAEHRLVAGSRQGTPAQRLGECGGLRAV